MTAATPSRRTNEQSEPNRPTSGGRSDQRMASFFVNDRPVDVPESRPMVRTLVKAAGFDPGECTGYKLASRSDPAGTKIGMEERVEGTPDSPCYLRVEKDGTRSPIVGVAAGSVTTPTGGGRAMGMRDLQNLSRPDQPRDRASDVDNRPPGRPGGP